MKPISLALAAMLTSGSIAAQTLEVVPSRVLSDEAAAIRANGLEPGEKITIRSELTDGAGSQWAAQAEFVANAQGGVDASQQAPVAGSYKQISAMGLVWAMMPVTKKVNSYVAIRELGPQAIDFHLLRQSKEIASAQLEQMALAEGVRRIPIREGVVRGTLFVPPGTGRHPAVMVVGGSNGGQPTRPAAWLASHGFTALALAYFRFEDLPPQLESIPLEYFQDALAWMAKRPEIGDARVGVLGTSRGGELALQLGSIFSRIAAVVAYVPANVRYPSCCRNDGGPSWTWQGHALAYALPRQASTKYNAAIEVEHTQGPILMISGEADRLWPSWEMADEVVTRLKRLHFAFSAENLKYSHAGHFAGRQEIVPAWHGLIRNPTSGRDNDLGGSAEGDAWSSIDSIPKVLEFLQKNLAGIQ
jgi:dienelactone hydrolase